MKTLIEKIGARPGARAIFVNAPADTMPAFNLSALKVGNSLNGQFDYIHLFCRDEEQLNLKFPKLKTYLAPTGMLWVSWPKAGQLTTDLSLPVIIRIGYSHGMVESKTISVNETWSAIKFTFPKDHVTYNNSFASLPG